ALLREALPPAFEQAVDVLVAEVPAPVALAQATAERAHVADLRAGDLPRRGRERREGAERAVFGDLRQASTSADLPALWDRSLRPHLPGDRAESPAQATETYGLVRLGDIFLLQVEQVGAPGQQLRLAPLLVEQGQRLLDRGRPMIGEVLHLAFPPFARASRTRFGVSGMNGTRTPRALNTALPTAAAVEMVGGSAIPITPRSGMSIMCTLIFGMSRMPPSL